MSIILKQSTQIKVRIGPFVDVGDGFTPEIAVGNTPTNLTGVDEAELLKANGAATVDITTNTWAAVSGADGWYDLTLTTSDTDTVGELVVVIQDDTVCLPVFQRFYVVEEAIYDAVFAASAAGFDASGRVDVGSWLGTAAATPTTAGVPEVDMTYIAGSLVSTTTAQIGVNAVQISGDSAAADNLEAEYDGTGYKSYLRRNTAQGGAAGSITLDASASAVDDTYNGLVVAVLSGTGAGQARSITDYNGTTKVATVEPNWFTNPSSDSVFVLLAAGRVDLLGATQTSIDQIETDTNSLNDTKIAQTLNLTASGNIGIDWANVENPTSVNDLSATDIQLCDTVTTLTNLPAITTNWLTAAGLATDAVNEIVDQVWDEAQADHTSAGSFGEIATEIANIETDTNSLNDGAISELAQAAPSATPTLQNAVMLLYMMARNKLVTQTSGTDALEVYNDAGTLIAKKLITDDGSDYTEAEMVAGP